ncbi:ankyrin repeat domain-containing protein 49-like [Hylaeus anthracinus]|uniref:ankyrin repeat domain-containing protein 49-like n=1 Tax=Hylaeus volcanicus TaxID=313075 RepID=UPI0023B83B33|nr:ankyrin repeat domain-containing protein 49-like [Hylaeus volcanicus]XP_053980876.1 ankyrin repeat domain-containing protein 49-like [Hylaeus volcanicus]XP_053980877.1 ankyrin repeat domain-containing protein 49-like [Hylaeus volcanicus]XP_054002570.1 ankyrin repeat domain-containing protein 49-like [Hylaeus anthracinus]XP_054002571.1 ankyrin repeat domain-containing protein 49-like [Hylaeus anthracinus]XP_054002572.1 ankyrin repeat domain-containing protein 49-like [Hylaeus anthracinus]
MSSSEEESDKLTDLEAIRDKMLSEPRTERMQVSAWEDDDDGVEVERNAKEPDENEILCAAEKGDLEKIKILLIKNPCLLQCMDKDGYTPLHRACYGNHIEVVEYLLRAGAKIDAKTMDEWQPLHSACCWNNVESAALLIANGANINAKSKGDQTPLHLVSASSHNSPALQLLLLHPDTNPRLINSSGDTAEQIARRTGKYYPMFEIIEDCLNII